MVRLLIGATFLASAGLVFGPAASASADPLCYYVDATGTVNVGTGPICTTVWGGATKCAPGQVFLGNPETISDEVCVPLP